MASKEERLRELQSATAEGRSALLNHSLYDRLGELDHLRHFMQFHVFAVWDFMSLLKAFQRSFGGSSIPWLPPSSPTAARLINEIVLAEESDVDRDGGFASHFELYYRGMKQCEAPSTWIDQFLEAVGNGSDIQTALGQGSIPNAVGDFVRHTFSVIEAGQQIELASVFTVGREDLLPQLFENMVKKLNLEANGNLSDFEYYLGRHIELDGDQHGPMAQQMLCEICGDCDSAWERAIAAANHTLSARKQLWDAIEISLQA